MKQNVNVSTQPYGVHSLDDAKKSDRKRYMPTVSHDSHLASNVQKVEVWRFVYARFPAQSVLEFGNNKQDCLSNFQTQKSGKIFINVI